MGKHSDIRYLGNPELRTIRNGYPGNPVRDGAFLNGEEDYSPSVWRVIKWKLLPNPQRREKRQENYQLPVLANDRIFSSTEDGLAWLGHATFMLRISGVTFLTDPCLGSTRFTRRLAPLPCEPESIRNVGFVCLSHGHFDHFDRPSLKRVVAQNPSCSALLPLGMGTLYESATGSGTFQEAGWYQEYSISRGVSVTFLPAFHWHRRSLKDLNRILWGSFLLRTGECSVFFAGDSRYSSHFREIRETVGSVDIALLPIGAYKPGYLMKRSHLSPEESVQAANDLGARVMIPMHYGTFDISNEPLGEPIRRLRHAASGLKGGLCELRSGDILPLQENSGILRDMDEGKPMPDTGISS